MTDYVLGTGDEEIARLGVQHRVWRARAIDAWRRAGIAAGQTVVDVGCGPGYASLDLAELVGSSGRVIAIDRSQRFLAALDAAAKSRGLTHITTIEADLDAVTLPDGADLIWCRWVAAFVSDPKLLLAKIHGALKPGGAFVSPMALLRGCRTTRASYSPIWSGWRGTGRTIPTTV